MNTTTQPRAAYAIVAVVLPGPDRKRSPAPYMYNVTYRNPDAHEPGCMMTWNVRGGREEYQVAAERTDNGHVRWHCTCADAVYRGENRVGYRCKHVHGLQALSSVSASVSETEDR